MTRIDKNQVLTTFLDKVKDAKRLNMNDIRLSIKEVDDLVYIITMLMSEKLNKLIDSIDKREELPTKQIIKPVINKTIIENLPMKKIVEDIDNNIEIEEINDDNDDDSYIMYGGTF